jgi:hypothetical protein
VMTDLKLFDGTELNYAAVILQGKKECIDQYLRPAKPIGKFVVPKRIT